MWQSYANLNNDGRKSNWIQNPYNKQDHKKHGQTNIIIWATSRSARQHGLNLAVAVYAEFANVEVSS